MHRFSTGAIGIAQGNDEIFSDFSDGGDMWVGEGERLRRKLVVFDEPFRRPPIVHVGISLWDVHQNSNLRADIAAEAITNTDFEMVFQTWGDSRIARIRMNWIAFGELRYADDWDVR